MELFINVFKLSYCLELFNNNYCRLNNYINSNNNMV